MSGYVPVVDRHQAVLFPEALDEYVMAESPVRVIDAFVGGLDMAKLEFARAVPAELGRPGYDPRSLLSLYVYGYLNRVRSSRRLERETHRNVEVMWLMGRTTPDHKTISDFRAAHPTALKRVFKEFTVVCRRLDLFGAELVGIDGSKFRAVNAKDQSFTPEHLRDLLKRIDARVEEYVTQLDAADRTESATVSAPPSSAAALQAAMAQLETKRAEYETLLATLEVSGATQVTLTDPESRRMKVKQGVEVCYNAQIAVDAKHHLLVCAEVTNDVTDVHQLSAVAIQAKETLAVATLAVLADRGYHNGTEVAACAAADITPTVPQPQTSKNARAGRFTKAAFQYLPDEDAYRCPNQALLTYSFTATEQGEAQRYYANAAACTACPVRAQCTGATNPKQGRRMQRGPHEALLEAMAARLAADPTSMTTRKSLVEHPFGTLKRWDDASYFLVRGLEKVGGEFSLMGLAYNVRRAINLVGVPRLLATLRAGWSLPQAVLATP